MSKNTEMRKPNILWITTDRQRSDTLGCVGNPFVKTPNLDRLAASGVLFEQAYCQSPICSPSRASFLTGRYPRATRVNHNGQSIPGDERLVPRLLANEGYLCGHVGKMHIAPGSPEVAHWSERRIDDGYVFYEWSLHHNDDELSPYSAWLEEKGVKYHAEPVNGSKYVSCGLPSEHSNVAWIANKVSSFIKASKRTRKPWFCTMGIEDPHNPFDPPREYLERYLPVMGDIPLPRYTPGELDGKPCFQRVDREGVWGSGNGYFAAGAMSDEDHRLIRAAYWAMIDHIDAMLGNVMDALRESGQSGNTIVVFNADHGEMLGDHGFYFQGACFYPEMLRVPLIIIWPNGIMGGRRCGGLVELVDVAPTLLEAAGLPRYAGMQGRSLWPMLSGAVPLDSHRDSVYSEYYQAIPSGYKPEGAYATAVRTATHALCRVHRRDDGELYDLTEDPGETVNRWNDPACRGLKADMLALLCDRMAETIDPLPPVEADY